MSYLQIKNYFISTLILILSLQTLIAAGIAKIPAVRANQPSVVINEIMWMGSTESTADEWIELYNPTDTDVLIENWRIFNSGLPLFPASTTIRAREYFLVSNFPHTDSRSILNIAPDWVTSAISLPNNCPSGGLQLIDDNGIVVDRVGCRGNQWFAGDNQIKKSMERVSPLADGMQESSWQSSNNTINLKHQSPIRNWASPKFANNPDDIDNTPPVPGDVYNTLNVGTNIDYQFADDRLAVSWHNFSDAQSGLSHYQVFCTLTPFGSENFPPHPVDECNLDFVKVEHDPQSSAESGYSTVLTLSNSSERLKSLIPYYVNVVATDLAGNNSIAVSAQSPVRILPDTVTIADVAAAPHLTPQGGQVLVTWRPVVEPGSTGFNYQVLYRLVDSQKHYNETNLTSESKMIVSGLQNYPARYEFIVKAIDHLSEFRLSAPVIGYAVDISDLILDRSVISVSQNHPGVDDEIVGQVEAINRTEPSDFVKIEVYSGSELRSDQLISVVSPRSDGSFQVNIGDNQFDRLWLRAVDLTQIKLNIVGGQPLYSNTVELENDIVGPNPPILRSVSSSCATDPCAVTLQWDDQGPDTNFYRVTYLTASTGSETTTFPITTNSLLLHLPIDNYTFKIAAFDRAGNPSVFSNSLSISLVRGVATTVSRQDDGLTSITVQAVSGSSAISHGEPQIDTSLIPSVQAGEPAQDLPVDADADEDEDVAQIMGETDRNWSRILIVLALLAIIGTSFWLLSRNISGDDDDSSEPKKPKTGNSQSKTGRRPPK